MDNNDKAPPAQSTLRTVATTIAFAVPALSVLAVIFYAILSAFDASRGFSFGDRLTVAANFAIVLLVAGFVWFAWRSGRD